VIDLPLKIQVKGKSYPLNLNWYRNAHYFILNAVKQAFQDEVGATLTLEPITRCRLIYTLYPATKHKQDVSNICSIVDKFFCDTLVNLNILPDDNYEHVYEVVYRYGNVDKENPRVTVSIEV